MRIVLLPALLAATPACAQSMADMPGMAMPHAPAVAATAVPAATAPPPVPADFYADRDYPVAAMDAARATMMREEGGQRFHQILFNLAEVQARAGRDGYRWDGEAWLGGDIDRAVIRSEGGGRFRGGVDAAEVQALYSHAIGPYFDLQGGVRQDLGRGPRRSYATIAIEGLAPYMFETEARLFVSTRGDLLGRLEGWYDQRLTQRIVLQPRVELNLAAQTVRSRGVGAGLSDAELGLRLRYEITRRFAPYVGVSYDARTGRSADLARTRGDDPTVTSLVGGVRAWF